MLAHCNYSETPSRPILRYHGGKWRLAPWIISHFPRHRLYVEPFGGAASVLLRKPRAPMEIVNDLNDRIVSVFSVLRDPDSAHQLSRALYLTPYSKTEYLKCRERSPDPIEDARRVITLAYQGHGSTGASGGKKTGWRRGDRGTATPSIQDWQGLPEQVALWCERLRGVSLECDDAKAVITRYDSPETLFYVDPPYVAETRCGGLRAYSHEMTDDQHRDLAGILHAVKGYVVLSGYDSYLYRHLYADWRRIERPAIADQGKSAREVLWLSPKTSGGQLSLFSNSY